MDVKRKPVVISSLPVIPRLKAEGSPSKRKLSLALTVTVTGPCALSPALVRRAAECMLQEAGAKRAELSIVFLSDKKMRALNNKALGHDHVTDVVTFNLLCSPDPKGSCIDGEIYVCPAEARRNAVRFDETFERELFRYVAHGILHLLGYNDATSTERDIMHTKEDLLLAVSFSEK
jgi:probable rRNA maturation factor